MKKTFQRAVGCILGLKSRTYEWSFLTQTLFVSLLNSSVNACCCTVTRVDVACDEHHGTGRLLTVYGDTAAELLELHDELPQVRRAPPNTLIQESINNNDATRSRTSRLCLQYLRSVISSTINIEKNIDDKMSKKHNNVDGEKHIATVTQKLEYKYKLTGRMNKMWTKMPELMEYALWVANKINSERTLGYDL